MSGSQASLSLQNSRRVGGCLKLLPQTRTRFASDPASKNTNCERICSCNQCHKSACADNLVLPTLALTWLTLPVGDELGTNPSDQNGANKRPKTEG